MRVLFVGCGATPPTFIERQLRAIRQAGVEVRNFEALGEVPRWRRRLVAAGLDWGAPRAHRRALRATNIVHFQWPGHFAVWQRSAAVRARRVVLSLRGRQANILPFLPGNKEYSTQLSRLLNAADGIHCVSSQLADVAVSLGADRDRIRVIRPAVETAVFSPAARAMNAVPRIAMVGALMWRKGYEYALLGLHRLKERGVAFHLVIAGEGPDGTWIELMIRELDLGSRVTMLGRVDEAGVLDLLRSSDVFLQTSLSEGISNGVIEAMSCGLPVVACDVGGLREAVEDGEVGLLVPARDPEAVARGLELLLASPELRLRMGNAARQVAVSHFDLEMQGRLFVEMYRELAG